jgi:hypothetical protein
MPLAVLILGAEGSATLQIEALAQQAFLTSAGRECQRTKHR